ncbi:DHA2 family efflux MFS transporter permease subunit [Hoeflea sp. WL0058]|uniref:DHA2 family efflux MFS transporter permease subunit n=1 Tax=Flavimaribacter sediminis TaxID=2865987 RepID=A0AAE2ZMU6_9HYPH|nr:DHA2 family efflux MFS transporter permease subunit [Flavimaribacter sediminis]MBW8638864.1 DHA2 family efflux MFS transporter permease subunit [Flavimaribacter sediminis]
MAASIERPDSRKWWMLAAMGGVIGIILLDETVVGVALPTIRRDLAMSEGASHWAINAYLLVFASLAAAGGKLGDILGHRRLFLASLAVFALSSLACGFSENGNWLIAARAIQGIGAAAIFPLSMALATMPFPPEERGTALGIYGAIGTTFLALGPLIGGFFTDILSWRWIFWINLPVVVFVAGIVATGGRETPKGLNTGPFDVIGLASLVTCVCVLTFGLMEAPSLGWFSPSILSFFAIGLLMAATFIVVERRSVAPLIEIDLFANSGFALCNLVIFMAQFSKMAMIVFGAVFLQTELHMSPFMAGLALLLAVGPVPILAGPSGRLADRFGARPLILFALVAVTAGLVWVGLTMDRDSYLLLVPGMLCWGVGVTFIFAPPRSAAMKMTPPEKHGQVGGIVMSAQLLGGTFGVAYCSALFSMSKSFPVVFLGNAAVSAVILLLAFLYMKDDRRKTGA